MGVLKLNDVEYSGGSSANIDVTTTLTEDTVSDTSVPSSKAVYDELQKVDAKTLEGLTVKELTANSVKNLIPYPYVYTSREQNGLIWTDNDDGTISVNGINTNDGQNLFNVRTRMETSGYKLVLPMGRYIVSGCPEGSTGSSDWYIQVGKSDSDGNWVLIGNDYGNGVDVIFEEETQIQIQLVVRTNEEVSLTFKPMLEVGSVAHDYVSYNNSGVVNNQIEILENGDETLPRTIVTTTNNGTSYLVNRDENDVRRQIKIESVETNSDVNSALKYETSESGEWVSNTIIHSGNIDTMLGGIRFGIDENGNYGYYKAGADTVTPFRSSASEKLIGSLNRETITFTQNTSATNYEWATDNDISYFMLSVSYTTYTHQLLGDIASDVLFYDGTEYKLSDYLTSTDGNYVLNVTNLIGSRWAGTMILFYE